MSNQTDQLARNYFTIQKVFVLLIVCLSIVLFIFSTPTNQTVENWDDKYGDSLIVW